MKIKWIFIRCLEQYLVRAVCLLNKRKVCQTLLRFVVIVLNQSMHRALSTLKLHECVGGNKKQEDSSNFHQDSY